MFRAHLFLSSLLVFTAACNGCDEDVLPSDDFEPKGTLDAGSATDAGMIDGGEGMPDGGVEEARILMFDGTSPVGLYFNQSEDLRFTLRTTSGAPVTGERVTFSTSGTGGTLNASTANTDANGYASVRFTSGAAIGTITLTAEADRADAVTVTIQVTEDPSAGLIVDLRSNTRIPVMSAEARIYIGTAANTPTCAALASATTMPTATRVATYGALPASQTFTGYSSGSRVTVLALGESTPGQTIGSACSEGTILVGGTNTRVTLTLEQLPTQIIGDYDGLLQVDLGPALPAPYDATVGLVTDILSDPAGWAVYQTLARSDADLGTSFVQWIPPGETVERLATFREVSTNPNTFNTWRTAAQFFDGVLQNQLGQTYVDVTTAGADISQLVRAFEVGAHYQVETSTSSSDAVDVTETWQAIVYTWRLSCPVGDLGCARRAVVLDGSSATLSPTSAQYAAAVTHAPTANETERFRLEPAPHDITLRYGAIVLIALNEVVFPNLPPSIAGDSLSAVLNNIIGCADVANSLSMSTGLPANLFQGLCAAAVNAGANWVEGQLLAIDSNSNPSLIGRADQGLTGGGEMFMVDADHDLITETLTELTMYAQWTDPNDPNASADLTAPIVGEGRRSATGCSVDTDCPSAEVCSVIPSYLKVQALENTCRRPLGATASMVGCAQDADCETGLCFDPGSGVSICYAACSGAGSCASGTCTTDAASVDLDPVLSGLGLAIADACTP